MNLLVAGGLLLLGVLFLVALVFVLRSEPGTKESSSIPSPVPTEQEEQQTSPPADELPFAVETQSTPDEDARPVAENRAAGEWYPLANGQFYEMVNELRSMYGQVQKLEYRLSALIDMVERVEQAQNGRFPGEEQAADPSDTQTTH